MKGSLNAPPIIVTQSAGKWFLLTLPLALLTFVCVLASIFVLVWSLLFMDAVLGGLLALAVVLILRRGTLMLAPDGITWKVPMSGETRTYSWRDVSDFSVSRLRYPRSLLPRVRFLHSKISEEEQPSFRTGTLTYLGPLWEIQATQLCDLLIRARARWRR